jgi:ketosteroid isomerase-like protein
LSAKTLLDSTDIDRVGATTSLSRVLVCMVMTVPPRIVALVTQFSERSVEREEMARLCFQHRLRAAKSDLPSAGKGCRRVHRTRTFEARVTLTANLTSDLLTRQKGTTVTQPALLLSADAVADLFAAQDRGDAQAAAAYFHEGIEIRLGNNPVIVGKEDFTAALEQMHKLLKGLRHELDSTWRVEGDPNVLVVPMTVHYTRLDDISVSVPCCNVFRLVDGLIHRYQVFVDMSPVFA